MNRACKKITRSLDIIIFLLKLIGMWYTDSKEEQFFANIKLSLTIGGIIIAFLTLCNGFYYSLRDLQLLSYTAPIMAVELKEALKLFVLAWNRKKVSELNRFIDIQFWKKNYNYNETQLFNEYEKRSFTSLLAYLVVCTAVGSHYMASPIYANLKLLNVTERELPFQIYTDLIPVWQSPYYEVLYFVELIELCFGSLCAMIFAAFFYVANMFTALQFKFLNLQLEQLCNDIEDKANRDNFKFQEECYEKLKIYIKKHQSLINYVDDIEDLYTYVNLVQTFGVVAQICFSGFQILLATVRPIPFYKVVLSIEIFGGSILQCYLYSFSAHEVYSESEKISESIYFTKWFLVNNPKFRKDFALLIQIMVHRARRPCTLTVGKFCPLNLEIFSSVMRTSLSYFTVLRQTLE